MKTLTISLFILLTFTSCGDRGVNFFSVDQDMELGESLVAEIKSDPATYPILPEATNPQAYAYIRGMMDDILKSDKFKYRDRFDWEIYIINQDVLNAFAAPGGKLYFYTGLINYLDDAASLAGVMGHEMAHADLRHSTQQMTKVYGFDLLLSIILGQNASELTNVAKDMALGLGQLKFSRDNEYDADKYSMYYLASTKYQPKGITSFFVKMLAEEKNESNFTWLSTHPSDQDRIDAANKVFTSDGELKTLMSGKTYGTYQQEFISFKALLK